jgi:hypothetical protein
VRRNEAPTENPAMPINAWAMKPRRAIAEGMRDESTR